ncbi:GntG family PLP-dependent aldolase [Bradyrhizobium sp. B097]|uniref:threonine aldolase family protein n=1 Tax=Bradyrhizobium sp. B097 TaxID=3140244 RepID=UPI003182F816
MDSGNPQCAADIVDLRSDTVTSPTDTMFEAMRRAPLGDDSRDGDPTVRALEQRAADLTGKAAALFVPSGTMGNLLAMLAHGARGGEVFSDAGAHLFNSEIGSVVTIAGLVPRPVPSYRGAMQEDALGQAIHAASSAGRPRPALIWMETSHNGAGGTVPPLAHMARVHALGRDNRIAVHVDGARLFNAAVALGVSAQEIAAHADSLMFCVSKGLSAPVGSLLVGDAALIAQARAFRRFVGGNMRQAGVIAAASLVALDTMIARLRDDHESAGQLARGLAWLDPAIAEPGHVQTNILRIDVSGSTQSAADWASRLKTQGILVQASGASQLRLVTHRHIDRAAVERTLLAFSAVVPKA